MSQKQQLEKFCKEESDEMMTNGATNGAELSREKAMQKLLKEIKELGYNEPLPALIRNIAESMNKFELDSPKLFAATVDFLIIEKLLRAILPKEISFARLMHLFDKAYGFKKERGDTLDLAEIATGEDGSKAEETLDLIFATEWIAIIKETKLDQVKMSLDVDKKIKNLAKQLYWAKIACEKEFRKARE